MESSVNPKILVATPMYGGMCTGVYTQSATQLPNFAKEYKADVSFAFMFNNSLIPHARNLLADTFLRHDFTHLFFIDADIEFKPTDFLSLIAANKPVIAGVYPQKKINWEMVHKAATSGFVTGVATAVTLGKTLCTYNVEISNDKGEKTCTARITCLILAER